MKTKGMDLKIKNKLKFQILDPCKSGEKGDIQKIFEDGTVIDYKIREEGTIHNDVTDVGIEKLLVDGFDGGTQSVNWYLGLVDNSGFSAFADSDTMSSHAGWTENTAYTEANRQEWEPDAPSSRAISNGTTVDFSINATGTLRGAFLVDDNTKSGTTGTLWATMEFTAPKAVDNGTILRLTYTVEG